MRENGEDEAVPDAANSLERASGEESKNEKELTRGGEVISGEGRRA